MMKRRAIAAVVLFLLLLAIFAGLLFHVRQNHPTSTRHAPPLEVSGYAGQEVATQVATEPLDSLPHQKSAFDFHVGGDSVPVTLHILNHDGSPAGGEDVYEWTYEPQHVSSRRWTSDADGIIRFSLAKFRVAEISAASRRVVRYVDVSGLATPVEMEMRLPESRLLHVSVVDAGGTAVGGAELRLVGEIDAPFCRTDESGRAALTSYAPNPVVSVVRVPDREVEVLLPPDAALSPGETSVDFVLELAGIVTGTVLTPWGTPLGGQNLSTLRRGQKISNAFTDSEGHFKAHVPLSEVVSLAVDFDASGEYISATEQSPRVRVAGLLEGVCAGDQNLVLQLRIAPPDSRRLRVRVQASAGLPVSSATVQIRDGSALTNTLGVAEFSAIKSQLTNVVVYPPEPCPFDWVMECVKDVCPEGQEVLVTLREGTRLSGRVILPDGKPASGARLSFVTGDSVARDTEADLDGVFTILFDARAPWHLGNPDVYILHADSRVGEVTFSGQVAVRLPPESAIVVKVGQER